MKTFIIITAIILFFAYRDEQVAHGLHHYNKPNKNEKVYGGRERPYKPNKKGGRGVYDI